MNDTEWLEYKAWVKRIPDLYEIDKDWTETILNEDRCKAIEKIDKAALELLCCEYDKKYGEYPEHPYEGIALFLFFEELKELAIREDKGKEK